MKPPNEKPGQRRERQPGHFACAFPTKENHLMIVDQRQLTLNFDPPTRVHRPLPAIVRRVARRARVSELHAAAFCEANGIGPAGAR